MVARKTKLTWRDLTQKEKNYILNSLNMYEDIGKSLIEKFAATKANQYFHAAFKAYFQAANLKIMASKLADDEFLCSKLHRDGVQMLKK